jgi:hypothetical protein
MGGKIDASMIDRAKSAIVDVVQRYGIELRQEGKEYRALCPFHSEKTPSFTVNPEREFFYCFGCGAGQGGGDAIDFVMKFDKVDFPEAVRRIIGELPPGDAPIRQHIERRVKESVWQQVVPVPEDWPTTPPDRYNKQNIGWLTAKRRWEYRDAAGDLIGYTCRFEWPVEGRDVPAKDVIPQALFVNTETGETKWRWASFSKPRPLYGLNRLAANPRAQVLVVEGEKPADAAQALLTGYGIQPRALVVISWPGGGKAPHFADWSPLAGRRVALWPDADLKVYLEGEQTGELLPFLKQPGVSTMIEIAEMLAPIAETVKIVTPPETGVDGWDLADPLPDGFDVIAALRAALTPDEFRARHAPPAPAAIDVPPWEGEDEFPDRDAEDHGDYDGIDDRDEPPAENSWFTILGYDHGRFYIFQHESKQISVLQAGAMSETTLMTLAPLHWWESTFPVKKGGMDRGAAVNWLLRTAYSRGIYDPSRLRGRGAWIDEDRTVFHFGTGLSVDGVITEVTDIKSRYTYELERPLRLPDVEPLTIEEGRRILQIADKFRWTRPASAPMLSGWVALAPLCGAMRWRPHIWLTGSAGNGKSTCLNEFVHVLMGGMDVYAQGNSTEAGIRQTLRSDALPVLFDESESNEERDRIRIQGVLALVRQASTESAARTLKGTAGGDAMHFHIRSMFCLASIQVGMKYQADFERMAVLALRPKLDQGTEEEKQANGAAWKELKEQLYQLSRDDTLPARLFRRSLNLLPITKKNVETFAAAAGQKFGSQRDGDQYGTLMAGAWSLISDDEITMEQASAWLDEYDWSEYRENAETDEATKALGALLESPIRITGTVTANVFGVIRRAYGRTVQGLDIKVEDADAVLQRHGMKIKGNRLLLSNNSQELQRLVAGTPYASDLRGQLLRVRGADRNGNKSMKFNGIDSKCVSLPLTDIVYEDGDNDDIPF